MIEAPRLTAPLAALLAGREVAWSSLGVSPGEFLEACAEHEVTTLMSRRLARREGDWPAEVRAELDRFAHAREARELLHQREIRLVLDALNENGVLPILFKGTPFAYHLYESPGCRPRSDTDLLVRREDVEAVHRVMARRGYVEPLQCDGDVLFSQFALQRTDEFGIRHAFDFHWKISTQTVFAGVLNYGELASCVAPVPSLGVHAVGAGPVHALLLACIHPVMHHRSDERLIWIFDIHLMASRLTHAEFEWFVELAITKKMAAVARHQLRLCQTTFNTTFPGFVMPGLASARGEPSAEYLRPDRRWHDELAASVRGLPSFRDRVRLVREVLFPSSAYMLRAYGLQGRQLGSLLLPALYAHRNVNGVWKIITGKK